MKTYINQLITDIREAHRVAEPQPVEVDDKSLEVELEAVENWAEGNDSPPSLSHYCGLSLDQFPPVEKLADDEIISIMNAFKQLLSSWHMEADIPEKVPLRRAYPLLINILKEEAWYFPLGTLHFDFCTGYAPTCELGEYCPCLETDSETVRE